MPLAEAASSGLLFDETENRRLADLYAPCFTLILQLRSSNDFGDAEILRKRIYDLFEEAGRAARHAGFSSDNYRSRNPEPSAKFALVAFIDETILSSDWNQQERWRAQPLQLELYDLHDAGEVFYDHLEKLLAQPVQYAEILEIYYLCMTLGFKGRYALHQQERWRIWIEDAFKALTKVPGMGIGALAPHGKPRDRVTDQVRAGLPTWALAAIIGGLALLIYIIFFLIMNGAADDTIDAIRNIGA